MKNGNRQSAIGNRRGDLLCAAAMPAFLQGLHVEGGGEGGGGGSPPPPPPPAAPPPPPPPPPAAGGGDSEPWYGKDVDAPAKQFIEKNGYKGWGDVLKTAMHQETLIGVPKEQLLRLPADRSPDKLGEVFTQLGKPKDVAGYEVKPNAEIGLDGPALDTFLKVAHEKAHLLPWQMKALIAEWYEPRMAELAKEHAGKSAKSFEEGDKAIRGEFKEAYDGKIAAINALLKEHGGEELDEYLFETGRGNDVRFAKFLDKIASLVGEPNKLPGEKGRDTGGKLSPDQAQLKLMEFEKANDAALRNKSHADHAVVVREREKLIAQAYPEPAT